MASVEEKRYGIAFFDVETTFPRPGQRYALLEFGSILVCPRKLVELENYSTLVRPSDLSLIPENFRRYNGISRDTISFAPSFAEIADKVYDLLHGRIWAGHNILSFDCERIKEAFQEIGRPVPEPKGYIDTWILLTQRFGRRAGDMAMASLASYFGLGQQTHRSLNDVRMNLEVLKYCAAVLLLESSLPELVQRNTSEAEPFSMNAPTTKNQSFSPFLTPDQVSIQSVSASLVPTQHGYHSVKIMHGDIMLKLQFGHLKVRAGVSTKFLDQAGRPRLNIVVDAPPSVCQVLDACDSHAQSFFMRSGSTFEWRPVVTRENDYWNFPTIRLQIPIVVTGDVAKYGTEICHEETASVVEQKLLFSRFDPSDLDSLFTRGVFLDAYISLDPYDYMQNAGIRLVAEKLVILSK